MEKIVEQGLLYDFYGELLNEHQRRIYEDAVMNDMSLSEIEQTGCSRFDKEVRQDAGGLRKQAAPDGKVQDYHRKAGRDQTADAG